MPCHVLRQCYALSCCATGRDLQREIFQPFVEKLRLRGCMNMFNKSERERRTDITGLSLFLASICETFRNFRVIIFKVLECLLSSLFLLLLLPLSDKRRTIRHLNDQAKNCLSWIRLAVRAPRTHKYRKLQQIVMLAMPLPRFVGQWQIALTKETLRELRPGKIVNG